MYQQTNKLILTIKTNIMRTLKNNFNNLDLQVKVLIIATLTLGALFTTMAILNGFTQF